MSLKHLRLPLLLATIVAVSSLVFYAINDVETKPSEEDVIGNTMVNTFMIATEPKRDGNDSPLRLGLVGHGTGFVYKVNPEDNSAIVVTNHHVIEKHLARPDITKLQLYMINRPWAYDAEVIGVDKITDIAVLRVKSKDNEPWNPLYFNLDKNVLEGTPVITVGHGLSMPYTVTKGVIAGTDRIMARKLNFMIQHSAIINVGNSGGPVVDYDGKVVAMNSMIMSPSSNRSGIASWDGVALGIPAWQASYSIENILENGYVPYSRIDFETYIPTVEQVQKQDKECHGGDVSKRSYAYLKIKEDAEHARMMGLKTDDIVTDVNGEVAYGIATIAKAIIDKKPGTVVLIGLLRDCKYIQIDYQLLETEGLYTKVPFNP